MASPFVELDVGGRTVKVTNPDKVYFAERGETKLDHIQYYIAVGEGIVRALYERPTQLKRHPGGAEGEAIYQKRVPDKRPDWIEVARVTFPSGRHADELCVTEVAHVAWAANLGTIDFHPWPSRRADVDQPGRASHRRRPAAGHDVRRREAVAARRPRGAGRARLHRLAEDLGQPGIHIAVPDRAGLDVPGGAPVPRSPSHARSSGARRSS